MKSANFSDRLLAIRHSKGLTQERLSTLSGITVNSIRRYERGTSWPTLFNAVCLADVLGCSIDYLAGRSDRP